MTRGTINILVFEDRVAHSGLVCVRAYENLGGKLGECLLDEKYLNVPVEYTREKLEKKINRLCQLYNNNPVPVITWVKQ